MFLFALRQFGNHSIKTIPRTRLLNPEQRDIFDPVQLDYFYQIFAKTGRMLAFFSLKFSKFSKNKREIEKPSTTELPDRPK